MVDIYVLNKDLEQVGIIDNYTSLIWVPRYFTLGDCELCVGTTVELLNLLKKGFYLRRDDDDMVCKIEKIEIDTDTERGDYLIITGYDVKKIASQRIIWKQMNFDGLAEDYVYKLITEALISPTIKERKINNIRVTEKKDFEETIKEQVTYTNLQTKIQEICKKFNWGYKALLVDKNFVFEIYKGTDRSDIVIFSDDFENILSSNYIEDSTDLANVALTAGEGEGVDRVTNVIGSGEGIDRYELYVDARDISKNVGYEELIELYPNGREVTVNSIIYYQINNIKIAIITREDDKIEATLLDDIYEQYLSSRGLEKLSEHSEVKTFNSAVEPDATFKYKQDYFLGDLVTVENKYGISVKARIVEVVEVYDENGKSIEPKFEHLEVK